MTINYKKIGKASADAQRKQMGEKAYLADMKKRASNGGKAFWEKVRKLEKNNVLK